MDTNLSATSPSVGRVIGTEDSTPLEFWVAIQPGQFLQLDDAVALQRALPRGDAVRIYGVVTQMRARHEGARFDSDVFLIEEGVLPAQVSEAAQILATRFEPEIFVPPLPGAAVQRAVGHDRAQAFFFDVMEHRVAVGLSRDDEPIYANLEFIDGTRGAHVNISGVSGVATKTTYAMFLLYSLFGLGALGLEAKNTKALVFNVKGEDLLFLDRPNKGLDERNGQRYRSLDLPLEAFASVEFWAPPRRGATSPVPDVFSRDDGAVTSFFWTLHEFCTEDLLQFLFADVEDERQQYPIVVHNVMAQLRRAEVLDEGAVRLGLSAGQEDDPEEAVRVVRTFPDLVELIADRVQDDHTRDRWAGRAIGQGTVNAFVRRLYSAVEHVKHLVRGDAPHPERHRISRQKMVTVVDIHNLNDRAQRFVVGVVLRKAFQEKERSGQARPLLFVVLDELNKYAPREGSSPIKEILLDIAERGRSLGIVLIGAQQTASEVERRVIANSSIRVVGRLDSAEAGREEYGFLPTTLRQRATIIKPGTMILSQPELPIPLVLEFPFPAWATRPSEAGPGGPSGHQPADPFAGLVEERV